jgi:methionyl-tRNA formyltransferase
LLKQPVSGKQFMSKPLRIIFAGTPEFAATALSALLTTEHEVVAVYTQPDRPAGRGRKLQPSPVKQLALEKGIEVRQPVKLKSPEDQAALAGLEADLMVVVAYGLLLPQAVLDAPRLGCINIHASLLPRWRGAAPLNAAILHGDTETGITIMKMDPGLDTGPMISKRVIPIKDDDTAGSLFMKMAELGAELLVETLPPYLRGELVPEPQDDSLSTYAPMLKKSDGELDFGQSAVELARKVRAFNPWPGTYFQWSGTPLKVHSAHPVEKTSPGAGVRTIYDQLPAVGTAEGLLVLDQLQPAGKKSMPGEIFLRGARDW